MEKDVEVGPEAKVKAIAQDGSVKLQIDYSGKLGGAGAYICATPDQLCEALAELIPGDSTAEHAALGVVKMALSAAMA